MGVRGLKWTFGNVCDMSDEKCPNERIMFAELLEKLEQYQGDRIFRGVSCNTYGLIPTALRMDKHQKEMVEALDKLIIENETKLKESDIKAEQSNMYAENPANRVMRLFYTLSSRQGLDLPALDHESGYYVDPRTFVVSSLGFDDKTTVCAYLEMSAIAQHYGFPTLLLDWTRDPYCALFFAVTGAMGRLFDAMDDREKFEDLLGKGRFSIWMLNPTVFKDGKSVRIFDFNHYNNLNVNAQGGLFTYVVRTGLEDERTIEDVLGDRCGGDDPPLIRYDVDYRELLDAMKFLMKSGRTAEVFFPGYEGVVRAMVDYAHYQILKKKIESEPSCPGTVLLTIPRHQSNLRGSESDRDSLDGMTSASRRRSVRETMFSMRI